VPPDWARQPFGCHWALINYGQTRSLAPNRQMDKISPAAPLDFQSRGKKINQAIDGRSREAALTGGLVFFPFQTTCYLPPEFGAVQEEFQMTEERFVRNGKTGVIRRPDPPSANENKYVKNEVDLRMDRLNDLWAGLEKKLLAMQPPRFLWCHYDTEQYGEDGELEQNYCLGIMRHSGKWRICHGTYDSAKDPDQIAWKPITECNIETRVKATQGINNLKYEVTLTGRKFIPEMDAAIDKLQAALETKTIS
jgi:hypothetical protein